MRTPPFREFSAAAGKAAAGTVSAGKLLRKMAPTGLPLLVLLVVALLALLYMTCTTYIHPDQFAVKQVDVPIPLLTGSGGIHTNIYDTGVHWLVPGCEKFIVFPKSVRAVTLRTQTGGEPDEKFVRTEEAAHIQTSDGFFINLDVSILYRVINPYLVVGKFGAGTLYEQNGIVFQAEPTLKSTMGTLHPEDFFNAKVRVAMQEQSRDRFNELIAASGLKVEHVLIRYPKYHEAVQARIEGRNIQEQTKQKNTQEAILAEALGALAEVEKQGEAALSIKLMEGSNYITRLTAQMDSYRRKKSAEANREMSMAEADRQKMINEAYEGAGSERLIGLEWARVLNGLDTIVLESGGPKGFNPLDMQTLMRQLKLETPAKSAGQTEPKPEN